MTPWFCTDCGNCASALRDAVLHQHLREVEIGADLEGHGQRIGAVGAAVGLHVEHVLDAVDLLLDRQRHGVDHGLGARAGIARGDLHGRRHHVGILRDREIEQRHAADQDHQHGDDVGENRPLDEEFGDHGPGPTWPMACRMAWRSDALESSALGCSILCSCGSTFWPGIARKQPADDDAVVRLQPILDHAERAVDLADLHLALLDHVVAGYHQHVAPALVAAERGVGHQQRVLLLFQRHADTDEIAGQQHAVGIGDDAAHHQRPGRLVDGRRGVIEIALVRIAVLGLQADLDRQPRQLVRRDAAATRFGADPDDVLLVDIEVHIDRIERDDGGELGRRSRRRRARRPTPGAR